MIKLGDYNTLKVVRRAEHGFYLEGDEMTGYILLPNRYVPRGLAIDQEIEVFLYLDQDDKSDAELIADRFKVSKKAYKKAIGDLYRRRLIILTDEGIQLVY